MSAKPRPTSAELADLVALLAAQVAADPTASWNTFCIAYRVSWDEQITIRGYLSNASETYYDSLVSETLDMTAMRAAAAQLEAQLLDGFEWPEKVYIEMLQACVASGMTRGFCAMALDFKRESLLKTNT